MYAKFLSFKVIVHSVVLRTSLYDTRIHVVRRPLCCGDG
jgi:hypothetical protein